MGRDFSRLPKNYLRCRQGSYRAARVRRLSKGVFSVGITLYGLAQGAGKG